MLNFLANVFIGGRMAYSSTNKEVYYLSRAFSCSFCNIQKEFISIIINH
jgi:hypothetical protein